MPGKSAKASTNKCSGMLDQKQLTELLLFASCTHTDAPNGGGGMRQPPNVDGSISFAFARPCEASIWEIWHMYDIVKVNTTRHEHITKYLLLTAGSAGSATGAHTGASR